MNILVFPGQKAASALEWVRQHLDSGRSLAALLDEAALRFDLDPKQGLYLNQVFSGSKEGDSAR